MTIDQKKKYNSILKEVLNEMRNNEIKTIIEKTERTIEVLQDKYYNAHAQLDDEDVDGSAELEDSYDRDECLERCNGRDQIIDCIHRYDVLYIVYGYDE